MPRMDGMELLRRLREKSDVPVIFLGERGEEADELVGLNSARMISSESRSRNAFSSSV